MNGLQFAVVKETVFSLAASPLAHPAHQNLFGLGHWSNELQHSLSENAAEEFYRLVLHRHRLCSLLNNKISVKDKLALHSQLQEHHIK